jgi:hypothetical protein
MMMALVSSRLREIARETVAIAERGSYRTTPGDDVIIGNKVARAVADTRLYQPDDGEDPAHAHKARERPITS